MKIFIDSDAYIALANSSDALHERATNLSFQLEQKKVEFMTSWEVVDEVATKLSYQISKAQALLFLEKVHKSDALVIYPTPSLCLETENLFTTLKTKRVSMTDCFNIICAKRKGISLMFSFDQIYKKNGLQLLEDSKLV